MLDSQLEDDMENIWVAVFGVFNALLAVGGYFLREAHRDQKIRFRDLENNFRNLEQNTVKKDDFKEFREELFKRLDRIEEAKRNG